MGNEAPRPCCCGKALHVRTSLPLAGEACHFRIPNACSFLGPPTFTVYDASAKERTCWLTLAASSTDLEKAAGSVCLHSAPGEQGGGEPLFTVALGGWAVRQLEDQEEYQHRANWASEGYGNQYAWEASRIIRAAAMLQGAASEAAAAEGPSPTSPSEAPLAHLRVTYLGLAGSTNSMQALPEIFTGDVDLEVGVCAKEWSCNFELQGSSVAVEWDVALDQGLCKFTSSWPEFGVLSEQGGDVRIRTAAGDSAADNPLLLCILGFAAARWAGPWSAEGAAAEGAEEAVLQELRGGIALAVGDL